MPTYPLTVRRYDIPEKASGDSSHARSAGLLGGERNEGMLIRIFCSPDEMAAILAGADKLPIPPDYEIVSVSATDFNGVNGDLDETAHQFTIELEPEPEDAP